MLWQQLSIAHCRHFTHTERKGQLAASQLQAAAVASMVCYSTTSRLRQASAGHNAGHRAAHQVTRCWLSRGVQQFWTQLILDPTVARSSTQMLPHNAAGVDAVSDDIWATSAAAACVGQLQSVRGNTCVPPFVYVGSYL